MFLQGIHEGFRFYEGGVRILITTHEPAGSSLHGPDSVWGFGLTLTVQLVYPPIYLYVT